MNEFYLMRESLVNSYAETKTEIISARKIMSANEVEAAKGDVIKQCRIFDVDPESSDELFTLNNGIAEIFISGMLVQKVDICAAFFGETITTYNYIRTATNQAEENPNVKTIVYNVGSGGGVVSGCNLTAETISKCSKRTIAAVGEMAASAAYWTAASCDEIIGISKTGFYGSIGVAVEIINRDKADDSKGIKRAVLTNTTSGNKQPDLMTEEGQGVMIKQLNSIYEVFTESILVKRSDKLDRKKIDNLEGEIVIASEALDVGLIDQLMSAEEFKQYINNPASVGNSSVMGENTIMEDREDMNLQAFLKENPEAKVEYDNNIIAAEAPGKMLEARINAAAPYIGSSEYKGIDALAIKVLKGDVEPSAIVGAVTAFDMMKAQDTTTDAVAETKESGDTTNNDKPPVGSADGSLKSEVEINAEAEELSTYL